MKLHNNKWTTDDGRLIVTCRGNIGTILDPQLCGRPNRKAGGLALCGL